MEWICPLLSKTTYESVNYSIFSISPMVRFENNFRSLKISVGFSCYLMFGWAVFYRPFWINTSLNPFKKYITTAKYILSSDFQWKIQFKFKVQSRSSGILYFAKMIGNIRKISSFSQTIFFTVFLILFTATSPILRLHNWAERLLDKQIVPHHNENSNHIFFSNLFSKNKLCIL